MKTSECLYKLYFVTSRFEVFNFFRISIEFSEEFNFIQYYSFSLRKIIRDYILKIIFIPKLCYPLRMLSLVFILCGIILANPHVRPLRNPAGKMVIEKEEEEAFERTGRVSSSRSKACRFFSHTILIFDTTLDRLHGCAQYKQVIFNRALRKIVHRAELLIGNANVSAMKFFCSREIIIRVKFLSQSIIFNYIFVKEFGYNS